MSADGQSIKELHRGIIEGKTQEELDVLLWDAVAGIPESAAAIHSPVLNFLTL